MENNIEVRPQNSPSALGSLTAEAAASSPNGDAFTAVFAGHSRTNPFKGQWGDDSKAMFENLMRQFDDELKDTKPDGGSKYPGSARRSSLPTEDKVCPEIVTEQKMVDGKLKDIDFVTIHGRCNSHNSNGANGSGPANGIPTTEATPQNHRPNRAVDPTMAEPEKGTQTLDYLKDSLEQLALGNYTDKVTVLGTGAQIATGLLGLDLPADIRDLTHDLTHWQWSWGHVGQTLLDGVGVLPVVGSIKYLDEAGALVKGAVKHVDETADMAKNAEKAVDKISDIKGGILKSEDANVLENIEKTETKAYIRADSPEGPKTTSADGQVRNISTGGLRNEAPLTQSQKNEISSYTKNLGIDDDMIVFSDNMNTGYADLFGRETLYVGTDVLPATKTGLKANSYVSMKGTLGHEIVGHRAAALAGKTQAVGYLEEAQASIRAARFTPDLSNGERMTLLRDGIGRLKDNGIPIRDVKDQLWIKEP